jgi:hypothetical protein
MQHQSEPSIISPKSLLAAIGFLALSLPLILLFHSRYFEGCYDVQPSISAYYHTESRDLFVGALCALSFSFLSYKGYDDKDMINDRLLGIIASVLSVFVALFPTNNVVSNTCSKYFLDNFRNIIHLTSASFLFITLAIFAMFQFTKSSQGSFWNKEVRASLDKEKLNDNYCYIASSCLILLCISTLIVLNKFYPEFNSNYNLTFWIETIMIWSFAFAWLRKSKILRGSTNS